MMTLYEKIKAIYPDLEESAFDYRNPSIVLQNDGQGDYIKEWNHPTLPRPTDEQLQGVQA